MPTPAGREITRRPIVLITVHRRYHELDLSVGRVWEAFLLGEFARAPEVWVVWAGPEPARVWYVQGLVECGLVQRVITRRPGEGEGGGATSVAESRNVRLGLLSAHALPAHDAYFVVQAADVLPHYGTFAFVDGRVNLHQDRAVVFHWPNGCVQSGVWHTNFFAVPNDPAYWPPLVEPGDQDVLERKWGLALEEANPPGVRRASNYGDSRFVHGHLSESLPLFPSSPLPLGSTVAMSCVGGRCKSWLRRLSWRNTFASTTRRPRPSP